MTNGIIYIYIYYHIVDTPNFCTTFVVHSCAKLIAFLKNKDSENARDYLKQRNLSKEEVKKLDAVLEMTEPTF